MTAKLCLNMIVKDEVHVIERCLRSVLPVIDSWVIVDTGSTDGTQDLIRSVLADLPGELHERPWRNFGHNRSEAIELARDSAEYLFFIDADDTLFVPDGYVLPALDADAYRLDFSHSSLSYKRICIVNTSLPWRFEGVVHEYPTCDQDTRTLNLDGLRIDYHGDGGRSAIGQKAKYARDVALLTEELKLDPDHHRNVFYLAQSYRDAEDLKSAIKTYERRAELGGWDEEVYYSLFQIAVLSERRGLDEESVVSRYLAAHQYRPTRAESLTNLARYYREHGARYALAYVFADQARKIPLPADLLFVDADTYAWRALDEFAIAAYWTGRFQESMEACKRLLASGELPADQRPRVIANLNFNLQQLGLPEQVV